MLLHEKYPHLDAGGRPAAAYRCRSCVLKSWACAEKSCATASTARSPSPISRCPIWMPIRPTALERKQMLERLTRAIGQLGRTLPRPDPAEAARQELPGDPEDHGGGRHQHGLHLGPPLPQESAGTDGRGLGAKAMSRDDIQKLLGGYATGTLTAEEQQALFEAALERSGTVRRPGARGGAARGVERSRLRAATCWPPSRKRRRRGIGAGERSGRGPFRWRRWRRSS